MLKGSRLMKCEEVDRIDSRGLVGSVGRERVRDREKYLLYGGDSQKKVRVVIRGRDTEKEERKEKQSEMVGISRNVNILIFFSASARFWTMTLLNCISDVL